jgi:hypothetical protein
MSAISACTTPPIAYLSSVGTSHRPEGTRGLWRERPHLQRRSSHSALKRTPSGSAERLMDLLVIDELSLPVPGAANPVCFVMKQGEVKQPAHRGEKEGRAPTGCSPISTTQITSARLGTGSDGATCLLN